MIKTVAKNWKKNTNTSSWDSKLELRLCSMEGVAEISASSSGGPALILLAWALATA